MCITRMGVPQCYKEFPKIWSISLIWFAYIKAFKAFNYISSKFPIKL